MKFRLLLALPLLLTTSCASLITGPPSVGTSAQYASAYWFRGTPINEKGVFQGDVSVSLPTANGAIGLSNWTNFDASNDTGDAISPDGNGGKATEHDYVVDYSQSFGNVDATIGLVSFNFPNGVGGSTTEAFLGVGTSAFGLDGAATLYWDFDELEDIYFTLEAGRGFDLGGPWSLDVGLLLGYMGDGQSQFYFGANESGLSDLNASATLNYEVDEATTVYLTVNGVAILDSDLEDALDTAGYEDGGVWAAIGSSFGFGG